MIKPKDAKGLARYIRQKAKGYGKLTVYLYNHRNGTASGPDAWIYSDGVKIGTAPLTPDYLMNPYSAYRLSRELPQILGHGVEILYVG